MSPREAGVLEGELNGAEAGAQHSTLFHVEQPGVAGKREPVRAWMANGDYYVQRGEARPEIAAPEQAAELEALRDLEGRAGDLAAAPVDLTKGRGSRWPG